VAIVRAILHKLIDDCVQMYLSQRPYNTSSQIYQFCIGTCLPSTNLGIEHKALNFMALFDKSNPVCKMFTHNYIDAIIQDNGRFLCPRCHEYSDRLKANVKRHLQKKKPCTPTAAAVGQCNTTHDSSVHTQNTTNNISITNNVNIAVQVQPYNRAQDNAWDNLFAVKPLRTIAQLLGCDLTDAQQALLACFKFQHLNTDAPERHSVIIKDDALRLYSIDKSGSCSWQEASTQDLWDVLCRRRQDFHDIDVHLQAKMKKQSYADLTEGLDDIEDVTNDHERRKQQDMVDYLKHVEDAVKTFHNKGVHLGVS